MSHLLSKKGSHLEKTMTGHEKDLSCECQKCYDEFIPGGKKDPKELHTRKLVELAEQEGDLKQFINDSLEELPNYNKICQCDEPVRYGMDFGDNKHQDVCLRCAGRIGGNGVLEKCPRCNSGDISASDWNGSINTASCSVTCNNCHCSWTEVYAATSWELD